MCFLGLGVGIINSVLSVGEKFTQAILLMNDKVTESPKISHFRYWYPLFKGTDEVEIAHQIIFRGQVGVKSTLGESDTDKGVEIVWNCGIWDC